MQNVIFLRVLEQRISLSLFFDLCRLIFFFTIRDIEVPVCVGMYGYVFGSVGVQSCEIIGLKRGKLRMILWA